MSWHPITHIYGNTHSPGRRQVCRFQRRAGSVLQSHRGPAAAGSHTDTWSAGSPLGSAGWRPSTAPSMSDRPAQSVWCRIRFLRPWTSFTQLHYISILLILHLLKMRICKYGFLAIIYSSPQIWSADLKACQLLSCISVCSFCFTAWDDHKCKVRQTVV